MAFEMIRSIGRRPSRFINSFYRQIRDDELISGRFGNSSFPAALFASVGG